METSTNSDEANKSWNHPWTTEEIRENRDEWSLAGDVGLLKHLQQFSQTLTTKVQATQNNLDSLNSELNETAVLIDNITNASLALANTQFIESRVYEDYPHHEQPKKPTIEESTAKELSEAELIAAISENIQCGLKIMDEKYERVEVVASDSEDDAEILAPSFILRPRDPYNNRPLPYVIGSDKWKVSSKIGIESSSSSDSDVPDDDNDSDSHSIDDDKEIMKQHMFNTSNRNAMRRSTISSSSSTSPSPSSDYDRKSTHDINKHLTTSGPSSNADKLYATSQDTLNSTSEIATPTNDALRSHASSIGKSVPNFAEELSKKLGNVTVSKSIKSSSIANDNNSPSINRSHDDLFNADKDDKNNDDDMFNVKSDTTNRDIFIDEVSHSFWNNSNPNSVFKRGTSNVIPASTDVPPPINTVESKPKSAMDDLFDDIDSDDSSDIFSTKVTSKMPSSNVKTSIGAVHDLPKNKLDSKINAKIGGLVTSTPENNTTVPNLFDDDDEDDDNLFNVSSKNKVLNVTKSEDEKKKPSTGMPISQSDLLSSTLGSKLFQRARHDESSESSENNDGDDEIQIDDNMRSTSISTAFSTNNITRRIDPSHGTNNNNNTSNINNNNTNNNSAATSDISVIIAENRIHGESGNSSGISVQRQSISSSPLTSSNLQPPLMVSTPLMSEELPRGRVISDSLLSQVQPHQESANSVSDLSNVAASTSAVGARLLHHQITENNNNNNNTTRNNNYTNNSNINNNNNNNNNNTNNINNNISNQSQVSNNIEESLFEDDVFSPPPLPKTDSNSTTKSKSKVNSLFDDSDSGDDLFSNTSSGSRSLKSTDLRTTTSQLNTASDNKKSKSHFNTGLFDEEEDIDIFTNQRKPDIDIFNSPKPQLSQLSSDTLLNKASGVFDKSTTESTIKSQKIPSIFDNDNNDDDDDLFCTKVIKKSVTGNMLRENDDIIPKSVSAQVNANKDTMKGEEEKKNEVVEVEKSEEILEKKCGSDEVLVTSQIASSNESKLFNDSDSDDSLFGKKNILPQTVSSKLQDNNNKKTSNIFDKEINANIEERSSVDGCKVSTMRTSDTNVLNNSIKKPPTSLKIRLPVSTNEDDASSAPRRAVSGKIKDLMGKMGDLKMLSPTDTPLTLRKSGDKTSDSENNNALDRDSEDGSSISIPSVKSPSLTPNDSILRKEPPLSPSIEIESAVSFDIPAQAESQTVKGSKILQNRARIPTKRRPQSRHARQSALRISGIDFDGVDTSESTVDSTDSSLIDASNSHKNERLTAHDKDDFTEKRKPVLNLTDDRSEISLGKEGSISITKNTLLSPSTDEEDLFDVPPDLPEDPPKDDGLFGRAPILSPIQRDEDVKNDDKMSKMNIKTGEREEKSNTAAKETASELKNVDNKPIDPLRDENHDPLKDPSQLFAFVTKTPSPEKGKNLLFHEDNSLFAKTIKKTASESLKKSLDLFEDNTTSDLFSGPFTKSIKKSTEKNKRNLFTDCDGDEDDDVDDLFGSVSSKISKSEHSDTDINDARATGNSSKASDYLDNNNDDDDEDLFFDASEKLADDQLFSTSSSMGKTKKSSKLEDIFGDNSTGDDDIFTIKKPLSKISGSLFFSDDGNKGDDTDDLFAINKQSSSTTITSKLTASEMPNNWVIKKSVTKDLRKTAEKIVEDPLSMIDDD